MEINNLMTPSVLFFGLGLIAHIVRSDLKIPTELTKSLTIYLLISIGLHGGRELAHTAFYSATSSILTAFLMGIIIPLFAYGIIRKLGKVDRFNAVAIATHYGSVSAGTFLTALAFLEVHKVSYESYPIIMLAIMETPAILVGLLMVFLIRSRQTQQNNTNTSAVSFHHIAREAFTNGSILLLLGGMFIGFVVTEKSMMNILPVFDQLFYGVLCIFLMAMGMEAGKKLHDFKQAGLFLIAFGVLMPIIGGLMGVCVGSWMLNFSLGGSTLVGVLAASASYIAVPPVMRMAVPEASPSIYLALSLGVTFPFNVVFGIPLYFYFAKWFI